MLVQALQKAFRKPIYALFALAVSTIVFAFAVWLPNIRLITSIATSGDVLFATKLALPLSLLGSITTNFTLLSATYTIAIAILFGVYISMMMYFLKRRIKEVKQNAVATGFLGITSGILGVGCAACGSFLLTSFSLVGAGGTLAFLPLGGGEFGIIGVVLLGIAVYMTAKQIENPLICKS